MKKILSILMSLAALGLMASCASGVSSETTGIHDSGSSEQPTMPNETAYDGVFPQYEPYGTGIGAMPDAFFPIGCGTCAEPMPWRAYSFATGM